MTADTTTVPESGIDSTEESDDAFDRLPLPTAEESVLVHWAEQAWKRKEWGVKEVHDDYDISPEVHLYKGDEHLLTMLMNHVSRDEALAAMRLVAPALQANRIFLTVDAHVSSSMTNPKTGERWGPGEMQNACNEDGACDLGIITDCIMTQEFRDDGYNAIVNRRYHVNHEARQVHWVDPTGYTNNEDDPKFSMTGFVIESVADVLLAPQPDGASLQQLREEAGVPEHLLDVHTRCAAANLFLAVIGGAAAVPVSNDEELAVVKDSVNEERVTQMIQKMGPIIPLIRWKLGLDSPESR